MFSGALADAEFNPSLDQGSSEIEKRIIRLALFSIT
jgi:hypothetical protein